jgi:tetratricopeptide (TPR) repeat protein
MAPETFTDFENYIDNLMSPTEKSAFEDKLKSDATFNETFLSYKETTAFLDTKFNAETLAFKENLKNIAKENFRESETIQVEKEETKVIAFKPWHYAAAASITLLIGLWFFNHSTPPNFNDYNQFEEANFIERGSVTANLKNAQEAFNDKDYKKAIPLFEKIIKTKSTPEIEYYYAIALLQEGDTQTSETVFNNLQFGKSIYSSKAIWWLALSKLKQNKIEKCKEYLKKMPKDAEDYEKAQELLDEL